MSRTGQGSVKAELSPVVSAPRAGLSFTAAETRAEGQGKTAGWAVPLAAHGVIADEVLVVLVDGVVGQVHADVILGRERPCGLGAAPRSWPALHRLLSTRDRSSPGPLSPTPGEGRAGSSWGGRRAVPALAAGC